MKRPAKGRITGEKARRGSERASESIHSSRSLTPSDNDVDVAERLGRDSHASRASLASRRAKRGGGASGEGAVHGGRSGGGRGGIAKTGLFRKV